MATAREQLAQFAAGSKALGRLCREYKNRSATVHLEELVGGALSFYAAAAVAESGGVHVFVAEDRDAAAYLLNDFYNLLDAIKVHAGLKLTVTPPPTSFGISTHAIHSI